MKKGKLSALSALAAVSFIGSGVDIASAQFLAPPAPYMQGQVYDRSLSPEQQQVYQPMQSEQEKLRMNRDKIKAQQQERISNIEEDIRQNRATKGTQPQASPSSPQMTEEQQRQMLELGVGILSTIIQSQSRGPRAPQTTGFGPRQTTGQGPTRGPKTQTTGSGVAGSRVGGVVRRPQTTGSSFSPGYGQRMR